MRKIREREGMRGPGSGSTGSCGDQLVGVKRRGPWTPEEDELLAACVRREGEGRWRTLPRRAGLLRCGKSCRLRWMNYLRPSVKRGHIAPDEEDLILRLHRLLGNRWSLIAGRIPGRTDNEIKNYWNTHISKKLLSNGIDPKTHRPLSAKHNTDDNYPNKSQKAISPSTAHVVARDQSAPPQDSTVALGISPNTWTGGDALGFAVSDEDPFFDFPDSFIENGVIFHASNQQRLGNYCQGDDLHFLAPSVSLVVPEEDLLQCLNFVGSSSS